MINKRTARLRRAKRSRCKMKELGANRLSVFRTPRHIYAQVIDAAGKVLAAASTAEQVVKKALTATGNVTAAEKVGELIAKRAVENNVLNVAFDRSGFKYHGRVKALADAARKHGLKF